jgi:aquaporin Z
LKKFIVELIGTFFLVFTVGVCVVNPDAGVIAPLAIGSVLMVMIYAGGHISGGHYNPAVTVAVALRGRMPAREVPAYILAQLVGALMAAGAAFYLKGPNVLADAPPPAYVMGQMAFAEFLFTFALAYVMLNVATAKATAGNSFYGLAIGFTVMVGAFAVGPISGGAFNPAVATGCLYLGLIPTGNYLAYIVAQLGAGALAAFVFKVLNPEDK